MSPISMASLQQRLEAPAPAVQNAAIAGVFAAIAKDLGGMGGAARNGAAACLSCASKAAVEGAVQALLQLEGLPATTSEDLLLTALVVATYATAAPLAGGLLQLFERQLGSNRAPPPQQHMPGDWRSHLLSKALLSNAATAQPLALGVARMLTRAAGAAGARVPARHPATAAPFHDLLTALRPFISFVLLDPQLVRQQPLLPPQLHSALARVACCCGNVASQHDLLQLLAAHLPALRLSPDSGTQREAAASAAVADLMDVVESCAEEPDAGAISALVAHLVCLSHDAAQAPASALLQQLVAALSHLAAYWPFVVLPHAAELGLLLVQQPWPAGVLGSTEARAVLALLSQLLQHAATNSVKAGSNKHGAGGGSQLAALLLLPLLQQAAFSSSEDVKQWAGHTLLLLQQLSPSTSITDTSTNSASLHGPAAAAQSAWQLLQQLWSQPLEAHHWLSSLQLAVTDANSSSSSRGEGRAARDRQQLDRGAFLLICALLQHPAEAVQRAALRAAMAVVVAMPLLGLSLLPLLVQQLQRQAELFLSCELQWPSRLLLDLLWALPMAGRHPAALPFVLRTLQPLLSSGLPEVLQAAGLRLLCRLWHSSGGRAYQQLRAAVIGFAAPGQKPCLALRVARAECLCDIATADPDKAAELVGLVQECLCDEASTVQAVGLRCVALLCEADVVEFYAAWRVVHRSMPCLPEHPTAAAAWVRLLGCGGLDAAVQPDAAAAIVNALWLAAAHEAPRVRRQAYASLAAFQFATLEEIGALRPLSSYAALLHAELQQQRQLKQLSKAGNDSLHARQREAAAVQAAAGCEALVRAALAYEHAMRRRPNTAWAAAAGSAPGRERSSLATSAAGAAAAAVIHKLQSTLPKQLLGGSVQAASDLQLRLPELPAAAVLYFYAPPPPPSAGRGKAAAAAAARQAAADYQAVYAEIVKQPPATGTVAAEDAGAAGETVAAWAAFLRRWLAAVRAGGRNQQQAADHQQAATGAALQVWEAVKQQLEIGSGSTPAAAANTVWAAAALCCSTPQPLLPLLTVVHTALRNLVAPDGQQPAAVKRAALAALGATAEAVRVTLGTPALQQLVQIMRQQLLGQQQAAAGAGMAAAAATGLGLACSTLGSHSQVAGGGEAAMPAATEQQMKDALGSLLSALAMLWPTAGSSIRKAAQADGLQLPPGSPALPTTATEELLPCIALAVTVALPAAATTLPLPSLLQQLHRQLTTSVGQRTQVDHPAVVADLCTLLHAAVTAGFSTNALTSAEVSSSLDMLLALAGRGSSRLAADGRVVGAAAAAAGRLLAAALQQGLTPSAAKHGAAQMLQLLLAVPEAAGRWPHCAAAKRGATAGVAALLLVVAVDLDSWQYRSAVAALEGLALHDGDLRARQACAMPLAALCYAAKRGGIGGRAVDSGSTASATAAAGSSKGLAQLAPHGALRLLLESLMEGCWVLPDDNEEGVEQQQLAMDLAAADAAAILRCLAAAERLPGMNYGSLCRRLLRAHSTTAEASAIEEVQQAVVVFAAAQGRKQQQLYHLASLATELLSPRSLTASAVPAQRHLLRHLPQLLAALPEAQAVSMLQAVYQYVSSAAASQDLLLPLLQATEQLLTSGDGSGTSLALQQAAQLAMAEQVMPLLPTPGAYPLHLTALLQATAAGEQDQPQQLQQLLSEQQRSWAAALRCLQLLPKQQLEALLQQPLLLRQLPMHATFATAALVAAGTLDSKALHHPRNLLLTTTPRSSSSAGSLSWWQQGLVAAFVGRAVATLPAGQQQQWLLDILDTCKTCASTAGTFLLAASIVASSAATAVSIEQLAAEHISTVGTPHAPLHSLPFTLPVLLGSPVWQPGAAAPLLLQRLLAAMQALEAAQLAPEDRAALGTQRLLRACLLAARYSLPPNMWQPLAALL